MFTALLCLFAHLLNSCTSTNNLEVHFTVNIIAAMKPVLSYQVPQLQVSVKTHQKKKAGQLSYVKPGFLLRQRGDWLCALTLVPTVLQCILAKSGIGNSHLPPAFIVRSQSQRQQLDSCLFTSSLNSTNAIGWCLCQGCFAHNKLGYLICGQGLLEPVMVGSP